MDKGHKPKRLYQVWKGSNRFFCGGRLIFGPDVASIFLTTLLIAAPAIAFCIKVYNKIVEKGSVNARWYPVLVAGSILTVLRNYRFFFMFVSTATILCLYVFGFSWIFILNGKRNVWKNITHDILADFLMVYCFMSVWFVGGLTAFHSYLICTNQTTYENFRYRYDKKENPYNRGVIRNIREIFFSKILPSMNKFRSFVDEDEHMAVGSLTPNLGDNLDSSKERIDIEMGAKVAGASNCSLPEFLQNLDCDDGSDDNLKTKEEDGRPVMDPFFHGELDLKESVQISIVGNGSIESVQCPNASDGLGEFARSSRESGQISIAEDGGGESVQSSIADNAVIESSQNFTSEDGVFINNSIVEDRTNPAEGRTDDHNSHQTTALVLQV